MYSFVKAMHYNDNLLLLNGVTLIDIGEFATLKCY